jgi:cytochrome P450
VWHVNVEDLPLADDRTKGWRCLREAGEVVRSGESYVLGSADAVEYAARHPELFSSKSAFDRLGSPIPIIPIATDPPEHARFRRLLDPFFSPRRMAAIEPQLREQAGDLIDKIKANGSCDVLSDLARPYPTQVFLTLFGLPLDDRDRLVRWKDSILELTDPSRTEPCPEVLLQAIELYGYLTDHIGERRDGTGEDLLTQLIATRDEGGLTDDEIVGLCFLFVLAGLDTVTAALGFSFATLARNQELRAEIAGDFDRIPDFVDEILRVEGPVPFTPRVTTEDVTVAGVELPKGTQVLLAYGAANRDSVRYDDPDTVHIDRRSAHFAFGRGPHRCLGTHLGLLELRIVLEEWHRRIPEYTIAPGTRSRVPWPNGTLGLDSVELIF